MPGPVLRFAPSPTGYFHVGSGRSALWNWLLARQQGGRFLLRIEDTDAERNRPEWTDGILSAMRWLGLDWDGEPVFQSQRGDLYRSAADKLLADGRLYRCDCTREQIDARAKARGGPPGYDGHCRDRDVAAGDGVALRFRTPDDGVTTVHDVVRGDPSFPNATIEDFVVVRGNGDPVFILANVVDDIDQGITHVLRGEEHLPNTPKALLLWEALGGGEPPVFAHLPVLVNEKRQKLSKRRDKVALEDFADAGYLPEAMRNYLCLLGWAPADGREMLTLDEMVKEFRLEDVNNSPAFFDVKKLTHFNGEYLRALPVEEFVERSLAHVRRRTLDRMSSLVQERAATLDEVVPMIDFFFAAEPSIDRATFDKVLAKDGVGALLDAVVAAYDAVEAWEAPVLHQTLLEVGEARGLKLNKAQAPVRVAITGRTVGPPLFESLEVLGRDRSLARLRAVRAQLP